MTARPNVLVIQADQFRWDCTGAAGNPDVETPALDSLAADGVLYTEAFCPLPVCTPSRYSLLSGRPVHQHGGWTNRSTLAPGIDTFPRALRRAGYRTAAVGKMHFTPTYLDVGYDRLVLAEQHGPGRYEDDYHRALRAAGLAPVVDLLDQEEQLRASAAPAYWTTYGTGRSDLPEQWHSTTWIGEQARRELDAWTDGGGQLLHVSFIKPHHPFDPPAPWDERYHPDALSILPGWTEAIPEQDRRYGNEYFGYDGLTEATLRTVMAHYYATITQLDHQIGLLLDQLRDRGMYDDTLVVFTSDHGEYLGFHHLLLKNGPMYDPLAKVPLVVKFPGTRASRRDASLVSLIDVAPTVLAAAGVSQADPMPGRDLADPAQSRSCVFAENRHGPAAFMARTATHKLLAYDDPTRDAFYDLAADPYELDNRIADPACAQLIGELRDALANWVLFDPPPPVYLDDHAPTIEAPNVPPRDPARNDEHREWFAARAAESAARPDFAPWRG